MQGEGLADSFLGSVVRRIVEVVTTLIAVVLLINPIPVVILKQFVETHYSDPWDFLQSLFLSLLRAVIGVRALAVKWQDVVKARNARKEKAQSKCNNSQENLMEFGFT